MPGPLASDSSRTEGPRPFSSEWLAADAPAPAPRRRWRLPSWVPDGRTLSAWLVGVVTLAVALTAVRQGESRPPDPSPSATLVIAASSDVAAPTIVEAAEPAATIAPPTALPAQAAAIDPIATGESATRATAPTTELSQAIDAAATATAQLAVPPADGPILPANRVLTYYGHPHDPAMGIVGEHDIDELARILREEAANYAAADPSRPVIPAFEIIATVAQPTPGADGTYILDTSRATLDTYIDYAARNGFLVVLDVQIGRGTVAGEIEKVRDLLALPHVHLAIDPEFAVGEGETPGQYIGSVTADSIAYAQETLAGIAAQNGIPPKILIVHQFREDMVTNREQLTPIPGVQLVIDSDGFGPPELKTVMYDAIVPDEPIEFAGIKLFYRQDEPLMTPEQILDLEPSPDVIIYQ